MSRFVALKDGNNCNMFIFSTILYYEIKIDNNVLNMAILSGKFSGEKLARLTTAIQPTYDSIRYSIRSGEFAVFKELIEKYKLIPTSDHFIPIAAIGNVEMFDYLVAKGLKPQGKFVFQAAIHAAETEPEFGSVASPVGSQAILDKLIHQYHYELENEARIMPRH